MNCYYSTNATHCFCYSLWITNAKVTKCSLNENDFNRINYISLKCCFNYIQNEAKEMSLKWTIHIFVSIIFILSIYFLFTASFFPFLLILRKSHKLNWKKREKKQREQTMGTNNCIAQMFLNCCCFEILEISTPLCTYFLVFWSILKVQFSITHIGRDPNATWSVWHVSIWDFNSSKQIYVEMSQFFFLVTYLKKNNNINIKRKRKINEINVLCYTYI